MSRNTASQILIYSPDELFSLRFPSQFDLVINLELRYIPSAHQHAKIAAIDVDHFPVGECEGFIKMLAASHQVLVVTSRQDKGSIFALLKAGASGVIDRNDTDRIPLAIADLLNGGTVLSSNITPLVLEAADLKTRQSNHQFNLNDDEIGLLNCVSIGLTKKEIADRLGRSVHTIDNHFRRLYEKLDVNHLGGAIGKAFRAGLIE